MNRAKSGFTIVELLIVIVVIAVLAAISTVAYTGIQNRARYTQQLTEIDKVGKAIQLWSAENGQTLRNSGAGHGGNGLGSFTHTGGAYASTSVHELLTQSGYLTDFPTSGMASTILLSPCTDGSNPRWAVMANFNPAPPTSVAEQVSESGCTNNYITLYTGGSYSRNFMKAH